jgi:hypothetical protein
MRGTALAEQRFIGPKNPVFPYCHAVIDIKVVKFTAPFRCPSCQGEVEVSKIYSSVGFWVSAAISAIICRSLHLSSGSFLLAFLVFLFPTMFSVSIIQRWIYPPKLVI